MKLRAFAIAALLGVASPVAARADLVLGPDPSAKPASDPPPADGAKDSETPPAEPTAELTAADPTSSLQGPPRGGCASCRVGEPAMESGALPLLVAGAAALIALKRRRR